MQRKTIVLFLFLIVLVSAIVGEYLSRKTVGTKPPSQEEQRSLPRPVSTEDFVPTAPRDVTFSPLPQPQQPPREYTTFHASFSYSPVALTERLASDMGLALTQAQDEGGLRFRQWESTPTSLSLMIDGGIASLSLQNEATGAGATSVSVEQAFQYFLVRFLPPVAHVPKALIKREETPEGFLFLAYQFLIRDAPMLLANYDPVSLAVQLDGSGAVRSLSLVFPPDQTVAQEQRLSLTPQEIEGGLNDNRGLLIYSLDSEDNPYGSTPVFNHVSVRGTTLAYLLNPDAKLLLPVYLIDGVGESEEKLQVVRYLIRATH